MFCSNCGQSVAENSQYCKSCGKSVAPDSASVARTDDKAIISLVCGVLALTILSIIAGIPAIILGHISRANIRKSLGQLKGEGLALAGMIMGYISLAIIPIVLIVLAIAIPSILRARQVTHETRAVSSLRTIRSAEANYQATSNGKYGSLQELIDSGMVSSDFHAEVSGYRFSILSGEREFTATATPARANQGRYEYTISADGTVHYSQDAQLAPKGQAGLVVNER